MGTPASNISIANVSLNITMSPLRCTVRFSEVRYSEESIKGAFPLFDRL